MTQELEELTTDRDSWKAKAEELQTRLHARDAADAWTSVLGGDTLHEKVTLEKLWSEIGYVPGETPPTTEEIAEHLKGARENAPYLFRAAAPQVEAPKPTAKTPLKVTAPVGRGPADTGASRVRVTKSQLQDPAWKLDPANKQMLFDAQQRGVLDVVD